MSAADRWRRAELRVMRAAAERMFRAEMVGGGEIARADRVEYIVDHHRQSERWRCHCACCATGAPMCRECFRGGTC